MTDRPIIFSAPMVRALLDGRKSQTRRVLKPQPNASWGLIDLQRAAALATCKYAPGDRLWVKEGWGMGLSDHGDCPRYRATMDYMCGEKIKPPHEGLFVWKSPIFMPRRFSRLTLIVTDVRVQRVQEISRGDAMDEGCPFANMADGPNPRDWYRDIWNSIHGPDAWDANPWVAAISFETRRCNIGTMEEGTW